MSARITTATFTGDLAMDPSISWWLTPGDRRRSRGTIVRIRLQGGHRELMAVSLPSGAPLGTLNVLHDKADLPVSIRLHESMTDALTHRVGDDEPEDDGA